MREVNLPVKYFYFGITIILLSTPLCAVSIIALSETLFLFIETVFLILLFRLKNSGDRRYPAFLGILFGMLFLTRYAGIYLAFPVYWVLFSDGKKDLKSRIKNSVVFSLVSGLIIGTSLAVNYLRAGHLFPHSSATVSAGLFTYMIMIPSTIRDWFVPSQYIVVRIILPIVFSACVVYVLIILFLKLRAIPHSQVSKALKNFFSETDYLIVLIISYICAIIINTLVMPVYPYSRILLPIYIPLIALLLKICCYLESSRFIRSMVNRFIINLIPVVIIISLSLHTISLVKDSYDFGAGGINSDKIRNSDLIKNYERYLPETPYRLYGNNRFAIYIINNQKVMPIPRLSRLENFKFFPGKSNDSGQRCFIIWFEALYSNLYEEPVASIQQLKSIAEIKQVRKFSDGTLYEVTP